MAEDYKPTEEEKRKIFNIYGTVSDELCYAHARLQKQGVEPFKGKYDGQVSDLFAAARKQAHKSHKKVGIYLSAGDVITGLFVIAPDETGSNQALFDWYVKNQKQLRCDKSIAQQKAEEQAQPTVRDYAIGIGMVDDLLAKSSTISVNGEGTRTTVYYDSHNWAVRVENYHVTEDGKMTKFGPQSWVHAEVDAHGNPKYENGKLKYVVDHQTIILKRGGPEKVNDKIITNVVAPAEARYAKVYRMLNRGRSSRQNGGNPGQGGNQGQGM